MAEEETGFTFVDKRRTAPEPASEPASTVAAETTEIPAQMPASEVFSEVFEAAPGEDQMGQDQMGQDQMGQDQMGQDQMGDAAPTTYDMIGYCINLLSSQAWQKLGLLADPQTGEAQPDLAEAKVAIDAVSDLAARLDAAPESVIPADLRRDLRTLVNDLRLNYVSQRGGTS